MNSLNNGFWEKMAHLGASNLLVIDRLLGCSHADIKTIIEFLGEMRTLYIPCPVEYK